jgi:septal ring factor EnvC (AmiA/AmiB activator)
VNWSDANEPLWQQVPEGVRREPDPAPAPEPRPRRRLWPVAAAVLVAALAGWAAWATYAMRENENRAVAWQERSKTLRADLRRLDAALTSRTRELNTRVDQLNILGGRLADAQDALQRSEGDVSSLEVRQRQLADEKAQLEDQSRLLASVARTYQTCKADLIDLLDDITANADATASYTAASTSCANADDQLAAFLHGF